MHRFDRRYCRYIAQDQSFAALTKDYDRVGKIIDISLGGLAFEYLYDEQEIPDGLSKISIFLTKNDFHLLDLTCRIIRDQPIHSTDNDLSCVIQKNTCSVQFLSLSEAQKSRLDFFIKNYTVGPAP